MEEENVNETQQTQQQSQQNGNAANKIAETAQQGKKTYDNVKNLKKTADVAKKLSMSGPLMTILFWVFVVIVAIIIITGIIMFLVTMPGMVMEKLKAIFKEIGNYIAAFYGADTTQQIDDVQIYETLDYIEDMGWDIKAEGFLTDYYDNNSSKTEIEEKLSSQEKEAGYDIDEDTGVVRNNEGNIILADSDFIFTYIMSDNYVYTLKNDNLATQNNADNWFESIATAIATSWYKVRNYLFGPFFDALGVTDGMVDKYGKGLIGLYYDKGLGIEGNAVNQGTFWNWDKIKIDPESKTLSVKRSSFLNVNNNAMEYNLDGWTGRYGMPLEFLLSVHKATMMPDLAYDMATSFPTEIHLLLHDSSGEAVAGYKTVDGNYVTWNAIQEAITKIDVNTGWTWLKDWIAGIDMWLTGYGVKVQYAKQAGVDVGTGESPCSCTFSESGWGDENGFQVEEYTNSIWTASDNTWHYVSDYIVTNEDGYEKVVHQRGDQYYGTPQKIQIVDVPCDRCKGIIDGLIKYLGENNDYNYITYTPYISKVTDHWYRDVYFVLNSSDNVEFVEYDYDYEAVMKERWTLYETYTDNPDDGYKYNPDKAGEFIVYKIDENGEYLKDSNGNFIVYDGTFDEARGNTLYVKSDENEYTMYTGVVDSDGKATDKDGNNIDLYRKVAEGEYELYNKDNVIAVAKKAVTVNSSDIEYLNDVGWIENSSNVWSAYKSESTKSGFKPLFTDAEIAEEDDEYAQIVMKNSFINLNLTENIVQVGEGQRAETNPLIKKMFLQNKYFRYDGSEDTAEIITELRKQNNIDYGALDENELAKTVTIDDKTYKVSDYAGVVTLNQDSLNAFSMLENTHTLDSDYIYRDFKELIVELGYFEKEELTDETPRLLQFPIPGIGSAGYPDRTIDKRENEFGTMIHSKHDIDANKKYTLKEILNEMGNTEGEGLAEPDNDQTALNNTSSQTVMLASRVNNDRLQLNSNSVNISDVGEISTLRRPEQIPLQEFLKVTEEMCEYINQTGYDYCVNRPVVGKEVEGCVCTPACRAAWETEQRCLRIVDNGDTTRCPCSINHCKHIVHRNSCSLKSTFEKSKESISTQNFCCNVLVEWALKNVGVMPETGHDGMYGIRDWCINELGGIIIEKGETLKPGDICYYRDYAHVDIIAETISGGSYLKFNGGHQVPVGAKAGDGDSSINKTLGWNDEDAPDFAIRLNWGNQNDGPYEGFIGNEAVVSPVSGILLDYGTYDADDIDSVSEQAYRVNVDLRYGPSNDLANNQDTTNNNGQGNSGNSTTEVEKRTFSDKVGYARILVLNKEIFEIMDSTVNHKWRNNNNGQGLLSENGVFSELVTTEEELKKLTDDSSKDYLSETVYGYKEFAETYEKYGIAGYILYIDGFKCELPDISFIDSDEDDDLSDESGNPKGELLNFNDFEISTDKIGADNKKIISQYEMPDSYKLASEKATIKLNVEETIKSDAYYSMVIKNPKTYEPLKDLENLIFIKEGTVLGRTYTNKELVEQRLADGDDSKYNYEYYAPEEDPNASKEDKNKNEDKLLGNYIRVIMRDENMEEIEDVETYMKLDEEEAGDQEYQFREGDLEILADAIQHEGGGCGGWAKEIGATTDEEKLYLSISTGYTIINKLNTDSGFKPDYNDPSNLWDSSQSPLYNLLCRIPDGEKYQQLAQQYGFTTGLNGGWYAIAPGLRHRIETNDLEYCDICYEAAEYIRDNDSKNFGNNGKFGSEFSSGEPMPHTLWEQGAGYDGKSKIWVYADENKNGKKDTELSDDGDFYLFDTAK